MVILVVPEAYADFFGNVRRRGKLTKGNLGYDLWCTKIYGHLVQFFLIT